MICFEKQIKEIDIKKKLLKVIMLEDIAKMIVTSKTEYGRMSIIILKN